MRSVASTNAETFSRLLAINQGREGRVLMDSAIGTGVPSTDDRMGPEDGLDGHLIGLQDGDVVPTRNSEANFQTTPGGAEANAPPRLYGRASGLSSISMLCEASPSRWFPAFVCDQRLSAVPVLGAGPVA